MSYTLTEFLKFIKSVFGQYELSRNELDVAVNCPECIHSKKKKLIIQTIDNRCHCWVCGYKARSLIHLLKKYATQEQQRIYLEKFYTGKRYLIESEQEKDISIVQPLELPEDFKLLLTHKHNNPNFLRALKYLTSRDISIDDIWKWKIGLSEDFRWKNRIIVPSFDANGKLNDYVGRSVLSNIFVKYDSPNPDKLSTIFNEFNIDWTKRLVLCEGVFDAMKCGQNVVPLLGNELNEESYLFEKIIINSTPIALSLDSDMWLSKTPRLAKKIQEYNIDVILVQLNKHDPGSMSKQEFQDALKNAKPLCWQNNIKNRLEKAMKIRLTI